MDALTGYYLDNMRKVALSASAKARAMALVWYSITARDIVPIGVAAGFDVFQSAALFAAFSMNARLLANHALYRQFIATGHAGAVPNALNAARRIAAITGPMAIEALVMPNSPSHKVKCFARSLALGHGVDVDAFNGANIATCDRWINRAATGGNMDVPPVGKHYIAQNAALVYLARETGLAVEKAQALVWCAIQEQRGIDWTLTDPCITAALQYGRTLVADMGVL